MLKQWLETEQEKLARMAPGQRAGYIWQYYKLWLIGAACLLLLAGYIGYTALFVPKENWLYLVLANAPATAQLDEDSAFYQDLADFAGYDLKEKNLVLDTNCYCKPSQNSYRNHYYEKLVALLDGGIADGLVMEQEDLLALAQSGRLLDLQGERFALDEKWADRLIYYHNTGSDYPKAEIPIGVDLTGSRLTAQDGPYPMGCAIALSAAAQRPEQLEVLLGFLFQEETK